MGDTRKKATREQKEQWIFLEEFSDDSDFEKNKAINIERKKKSKRTKKIRKEKATMPKKVLKKPKKRLVDDRQKDERTIIERKEEYTYSYDIHVDKCTTLPECSSDSDTGSE